MGLAPYGEPKFVDKIKSELVHVNPDGSIRLNMDYFDYLSGMKMTNDKFNELFGGLPRDPESQITQREMDLAKSIQTVTEEIIMKMANHAPPQKCGREQASMSWRWRHWIAVN